MVSDAGNSRLACFCFRTGIKCEILVYILLFGLAFLSNAWFWPACSKRFQHLWMVNQKLFLRFQRLFWETRPPPSINRANQFFSVTCIQIYETPKSEQRHRTLSQQQLPQTAVKSWRPTRDINNAQSISQFIRNVTPVIDRRFSRANTSVTSMFS